MKDCNSLPVLNDAAESLSQALPLAETESAVKSPAIAKAQAGNALPVLDVESFAEFNSGSGTNAVESLPLIVNDFEHSFDSEISSEKPETFEDSGNLEKPQLLPDYAINKLKNAHYGIIGRHSAVQICQWTKKALRGTAVCYKQKFYGIDCHRCMEFSPAVLWCQQKCVYCWRPSEFMKKLEVSAEEVDDPVEILEQGFKVREKLLSGFGGNEKVDLKRLEEAMIPSHFAISLSGEPTMYPKLDEIIKILKNRSATKSIFLVSNAQLPEMFEKLKQNNALPDQLYVSIHSPNKELFQKIGRPLYSDGWERLQKSLKLLKDLDCRKVLRLTLLKGLNDMDELLPQFAKMIDESKTDFLEIKSYVHIGMSQQRLKKENMHSHAEILEFSQKLLKHLKSFKLENDCESSMISLLKNANSKHKTYQFHSIIRQKG